MSRPNVFGVFFSSFKGSYMEGRLFPIILVSEHHNGNSDPKFTWDPSEMCHGFKQHESSVRSCLLYIYKGNIARS